ncbi:hypothetical protein GPZ77_34510 (plasmid) [Streptomyces sp. QHH-9511]|uniref:hypothetical protein n=1 Tax=Streptomyces sp. QHH-9511 TaxID=2684468 RepID=UPI0013179199|nr:hypothetical protein [Streptomyces sp. QHH-9511]QGZ53345.1 hypothetical protein GPZ77_34510 [Streptomyces sp. QHH-9511]
MPSKQTAAAAAVAAGQNLVNTVAQHGLTSPETQQATNAAAVALDTAEAAGCTRDDYANARNR